MVLSSVRDHLCGDPHGAATTETDLKTLTDALGPFANPTKIVALLNEVGGLHGLVTADANKLTALLSDGDDAARLSAMLALAASLGRPTNVDHPIIDDCAALIGYLQKAMGSCRVETFRVLFLDTHNRIVADEVLWTGTISQVQVYPREIMRRALELDSSAFIAAHNHPSSVVAPSRSDIAMTRTILGAARTLNIAFHDHIIVSPTSYHSMRIHKSIDPWG